jgi:hypothetical protein
MFSGDSNRGKRMCKSLSCAVAVMSLAVAGAVLADDAPPTPEEVVGYAGSLARSASQGDKNALGTLQTNAAMNDPGAEFGLGELGIHRGLRKIHLLVPEGRRPGMCLRQRRPRLQAICPLGSAGIPRETSRIGLAQEPRCSQPMMASV